MHQQHISEPHVLHVQYLEQLTLDSSWADLAKDKRTAIDGSIVFNGDILSSQKKKKHLTLLHID